MNIANSRIQLTLFVPPPNAELIESVRRLVDPIQHQLIPAHVTLCREDEFAHPRNPKAEHNDLGYASAMLDTLTVTFREISRIEQHGAAPWAVLEAFTLDAGTNIANARHR